MNGVAVLGVGDGDQRVARPHPLSVEVEADGEHPTSAAASGTQVGTSVPTHPGSAVTVVCR